MASWMRADGDLLEWIWRWPRCTGLHMRARAPPHCHPRLDVISAIYRLAWWRRPGKLSWRLEPSSDWRESPDLIKSTIGAGPLHPHHRQPAYRRLLRRLRRGRCRFDVQKWHALQSPGPQGNAGGDNRYGFSTRLHGPHQSPCCPSAVGDDDGTGADEEVATAFALEAAAARGPGGSPVEARAGRHRRVRLSCPRRSPSSSDGGWKSAKGQRWS